jgi:CRP-like cAMP-binding protein
LEPLISEVNFFKERSKGITEKDLAHVCQYLETEVREAGETVYKEGESSNKFYIILKGKVQVSVQDAKKSNLRLDDKSK